LPAQAQVAAWARRPLRSRADFGRTETISLSGPSAGEESLERLGQAGFSADYLQAAEKEMGFQAKIEEEIEILFYFSRSSFDEFELFFI
jgi:hypothetical protein